MSGEIYLKKLIAAMTPVLAETEYVFGMLDTNSYKRLVQLEPMGTFQEKEGLTVIVKKKWKSLILNIQVHLNVSL
jgi:hypothetical protein